MITRESTYSVLKGWFLENWEDLPENLRGEDKYYSSVQFTANMWINQVESVISKTPKEVKQSIPAKAAKKNLYDLYVDLQKKENWNKGMETIEEHLKRKESI